MRTKPVIRMVAGRWDWSPVVHGTGSGTGPSSLNYKACWWCMTQNSKEGR